MCRGVARFACCIALFLVSAAQSGAADTVKLALIDPLTGPFAIQELGNDIYAHAEAAAGPGMHVIEIESGPTAIDDEMSGAFIERWLARLASAYDGRLRPF